MSSPLDQLAHVAALHKALQGSQAEETELDSFVFDNSIDNGDFTRPRFVPQALEEIPSDMLNQWRLPPLPAPSDPSYTPPTTTRGRGSNRSRGSTVPGRGARHGGSKQVQDISKTAKRKTNSVIIGDTGSDDTNTSNKSTTLKRKAVDQHLSDASDEEAPSSKHNAKKRKETKRREEEDNTSDSDKEPLTLTAYIQVQRPAPPDSSGTRRKKSASAMAPAPIERGPFTFHDTDSYRDFLRKLAKALPCAVSSLPLESIHWRAQRPANFAPLILGGDTGYKALLQEFRGRKASQGFNLILTMPPPAASMNTKVPWVTGDDNIDNEPHFEDVPEFTSTYQSVAEQRSTFDEANSNHREALENQYPVNNNPLYPGKRVYVNAENTAWELNATRLDIWASHLAKGTEGVSLLKPPNSNFFDFSKRLPPPKNSKNSAAPVANADSSPVPSTAMAIAPAPPSSLETFVMGLIQQQQMQLQNQQLMQLYMHPATNFASNASLPMFPIQAPAPFVFPSGRPKTPQPQAPATLSSAPTSPLKFRPVSLEEFCVYYSLDDSISSGLQRLKYTPGDRNIEKLEREDWRDDGRLSKLEWQKVLDSHGQFLKDVRNGIWA